MVFKASPMLMCCAKIVTVYSIMVRLGAPEVLSLTIQVQDCTF